MSTFPLRLQKVLDDKQISQSELARRIGRAQTVVNRYCLGKKKPPIDVLILICKELDVSSDYLLGLKNRTNS